jgi:cytochrome o ubiquinol oxidase subunit 2
MQTQLHAVINKPGVYEGISANYSGAGFSGMHFKLRAMSEAEFGQWVAGLRAAPAQLTRTDYLQLVKPSADEPVRRYAGVEPGLFLDVVDQCVEPGSTCKHGGMPGMNHAEAAKALCKTPPQRVAQNEQPRAAAGGRTAAQ